VLVCLGPECLVITVGDVGSNFSQTGSCVGLSVVRIHTDMSPIICTTGLTVSLYYRYSVQLICVSISGTYQSSVVMCRCCHRRYLQFHLQPNNSGRLLLYVTAISLDVVDCCHMSPPPVWT